MKIYFIILLLALKQTYSKFYNATFVLAWLGGVCKVLGPQCDQTRYSQWDHKSFTIHELQVDHPADNYYGPFDKQLIEKHNYFKQMYSSWPPQLKANGDPCFLWSHSWDKFGHSFTSIIEEQLAMTKQNPEFNEPIKLLYFQSALSYDFKGGRKLNASVFTSPQFARMLNLPHQSINPVCSKDGVLTNIKICLRLDINLEQKVLKFNPRNCSTKELQETCKHSTIFLEDWRQKYEITFKDNSYFKYEEEMAYYPLESEIRGGMGRLYSEIQVNLLFGFFFACTVVAVSVCWICLIVAYLKRVNKKKSHAQQLFSNEPSQVSQQGAEVELAEAHQDPINSQPN